MGNADRGFLHEFSASADMRTGSDDCFHPGILLGDSSRTLIGFPRHGIRTLVAAVDGYIGEFRDYQRASGFPTEPDLLNGLPGGVELYSSGGASAGPVGYGLPGNQALSGSSGGAPDLSAPIRIDFTSPQNVVGFEVLDLSPFGAETVELTVFYSVIDPLFSILFPSPRPPRLCGEP